MFLSIIIPLYNEEELILQVLDKVTALSFPSYVSNTEIIIVDDCSTDASLERVTNYVQNRKGVYVFHQEINRGKGAAVRKGIEHAKGDVFLIQDADLELCPDDIPSMLSAMNKLNIEFVNGSRYLQGVVRPLASYKRYLANKLFTFLTSVLVDVKLTDMACGYKLVHRNLIEKIQLKEDRFGFEAELISKALRVKRNNIAEVPVQYFPRNEGEGKKFKTKDAFNILRTIFKYGFLRMK